MINKLPVVVSDTGGLSEIVENGINGLKVPPNNSEELAKQLTVLFSNENLRKRISELGYKTVREKYNWKEIAYKTLEVYKEAML